MGAYALIYCVWKTFTEKTAAAPPRHQRDLRSADDTFEAPSPTAGGAPIRGISAAGAMSSISW